MSQAPQPIRVTAWLVVTGSRSQYGAPYPPGHPAAGERKFISARISKVTKNKPDNLGPDDVAFPITIDLDDSWFINPTATIQVSLPTVASAAPVAVVDHDMAVKGRAPSPAARVVKGS